MKRKNYRITSTAGHDALRHAWNSARSAMVDLMREHASRVGGYWECSPTAVHVVKQNGAHVRGQFGWIGDGDGEPVIFTIVREEPAA